MRRFFVEVPHDPDKLSCAKAIKVFLESGQHYLTHAEWGCADGEHCGMLIIEATDKEEACLIIPPAFRADAKIVELRHFTVEEIDKVIQSHGEEGC